MATSPGHKQDPNHKVREEKPNERVEVFLDGQKIADSTDVVKVLEDQQPPRFYIPRKDVQMNALEKSDSTYDCPFKGHAQYYSLKMGERKLDDAIWSYEQPYDEHMDIKDRMAFYTDKYPEITIRETFPRSQAPEGP
jgi:uncharacterized protein (DUF427 family)